MIINIAASHRFHLLDLARELEKHGHKVRFYSYVPTKRVMSFGLKRECCYSMLFLVLPFLFLRKIFPTSNKIQFAQNSVIDYYMGIFMKKCDVFICLGSVYKYSIEKAKKKFSAITILEWGSKHILEQLGMFADNPNKKRHSPIALKKELDSFQIADYISIPSEHVRDSFLLHKISNQKLLINPYGVDLTMFHPTILTKPFFDIIMVGGWRYEKGCDLIIEVCRRFKFSLLHVGSLAGMDFPKDENMKHVDSVDQRKLFEYYSQGKVFILPSRADGFGMVLSQALACGLPIVCSQHTGGRDLAQFLDDKKWIVEMQEYTVKELGRCIKQSLTLADTQEGERLYAEKALEHLTWKAYGERYNVSLKKIESINKSK